MAGLLDNVALGTALIAFVLAQVLKVFTHRRARATAWARAITALDSALQAE